MASCRLPLRLPFLVAPFIALTCPGARAHAADMDHDGVEAPLDCNDADPGIHPGAADEPDDTFQDTNCDGIDGDASRAVFVAPGGDDANPGTRSLPFQTLERALDQAVASGKDHVYVSEGVYAEAVTVRDGVSIWGGFSQVNGWSRSAAFEAVIRGGSIGLVARSITSLTKVESLTITNAASVDAPPPGLSMYAVYLHGAPGLTLRRNRIQARDGSAGQAGFDGAAGTAGGNGGAGGNGRCDGSPAGLGGLAGTSGCGNPGGRGGTGGTEGANQGLAGENGRPATPGGAGGSGGSFPEPGLPGQAGASGAPGSRGANGFGGRGSSIVDGFWAGAPGSDGQEGTPGNGAGGGGGGGGQGGIFISPGSGNGGGGGGGRGAQAGGASFGVFAVSSTGFGLLENTISSGNGGAGGASGLGGDGGAGGSGAAGGAFCTDEIGAGGTGGTGGSGGGAGPSPPFPSCGPDPGSDDVSCDSFAACGAGGGGGGALQPNVHVLSEVRSDPRDPRLVDLSPVTGEIVINDPPGGMDLAPGDIIAGFVPLTSDAIHEGVTYLLKLEEVRPESCLASSPADRIFGGRTATLVEVFEEADLRVQMPLTGAEQRLQPAVTKSSGWCEVIGGGAAAAARGDGAGIGGLVDLDLEGISVLNWQQDNNHIRAGFHKLRVLYSSGDASLGVGISNGGLTGVSFFSGMLLDATVVAYVDTHFEKVIHEEKKLVTLRKDHIVLLLGVPIHFAVTGDLYAGIDANAQLNLYAEAGARSSFTAGLGFRFDGEKIHNLSGLDPPTFEPVPDTPYLDLNGSISVRPYLRPEVHLFAGILIKGLTADLGIRSEVFTRFHAAGSTQPFPCFNWGIDGGMSVTLVPEIQLFGYDLFDQTFDVIRFEENNILGGELGCHFPPVARVSYRVVRLSGSEFEVHLDASGSQDPDGDPLRFRWDFNGDGICDRTTGTDPRTVYVTGEDVLMKLTVTDDENQYVERQFRVVLNES